MISRCYAPAWECRPAAPAAGDPTRRRNGATLFPRGSVRAGSVRQGPGWSRRRFPSQPAGVLGLDIIPAIALTARPLVRTADPTDRGPSVVRCADRRAGWNDDQARNLSTRQRRLSRVDRHVASTLPLAHFARGRGELDAHCVLAIAQSSALGVGALEVEAEAMGLRMIVLRRDHGERGQEIDEAVPAEWPRRRADPDSRCRRSARGGAVRWSRPHERSAAG